MGSVCGALRAPGWCSRFAFGLSPLGCMWGSAPSLPPFWKQFCAGFSSGRASATSPPLFPDGAACTALHLSPAPDPPAPCGSQAWPAGFQLLAGKGAACLVGWWPRQARNAVAMGVAGGALGPAQAQGSPMWGVQRPALGSLEAGPGLASPTNPRGDLHSVSACSWASLRPLWLPRGHLEWPNQSSHLRAISFPHITQATREPASGGQEIHLSRRLWQRPGLAGRLLGHSESHVRVGRSVPRWPFPITAAWGGWRRHREACVSMRGAAGPHGMEAPPGPQPPPPPPCSSLGCSLEWG